MGKEALTNFDLSMQANIYREGQVFNTFIPQYLAVCAALMDSSPARSVYWIPVGVRPVCSPTIKPPDSRSTARIGPAHGREEQGSFAHLEVVQKKALVHQDLWSLIWAQRGLAHFYFIQGQTRKSYEILRESQATMGRVGLKRGFYWVPWILEILFEYHVQGYKPIPGCNFEEEMTLIRKGVNVFLQGVALRIQAKQTEMEGEDPTRIENLLRKSEAKLKRTGTLMELAKTKAELARLKLAQGFKEEALDLALQAREGLLVFGEPFFSEELKSLIATCGGGSEDQNQSEILLKRYMEMMDELIPTADQEQLFSHLSFAATSRFFEAERGAIFWFGDEEKIRR